MQWICDQLNNLHKEIYRQMSRFILKWLDLACENSQNSMKDHTF